jgi:multiple sugar transport system substrate-binding protein
MLAAAERWRKLSDEEVDWDFRPLASFNDQPVTELAVSYDLLVNDHPLVGTAAATRCLAPFDELREGRAPAAIVRKLAALRSEAASTEWS